MQRVVPLVGKHCDVGAFKAGHYRGFKHGRQGRKRRPRFGGWGTIPASLRQGLHDVARAVGVASQLSKAEGETSYEERHPQPYFEDVCGVKVGIVEQL